MLTYTQETDKILIVVPAAYEKRAREFFLELNKAELRAESSGQLSFKALPDFSVMTDEGAADYILQYVFDKIKSILGREENALVSKFYRALDRHSNGELGRIHKQRTERLKGYSRGVKPYRKIDTAVACFGADYIFNFAADYNFESVAA